MLTNLMFSLLLAGLPAKTQGTECTPGNNATCCQACDPEDCGRTCCPEWLCRLLCRK